MFFLEENEEKIIRFSFLQYIGLKDKKKDDSLKREEIYEGDILKDNDDLYIVKYSTESFKAVGVKRH